MMLGDVISASSDKHNHADLTSAVHTSPLNCGHCLALFCFCGLQNITLESDFELHVPITMQFLRVVVPFLIFTISIGRAKCCSIANLTGQEQIPSFSNMALRSLFQITIISCLILVLFSEIQIPRLHS